MNEYISVVAAGERERMKNATTALVGAIAERGLVPWICALTEVSGERLEELRGGAEPAATEVLALTEGIRLLAESEETEELKTLYNQAAAVVSQWGSRVCKGVRDSLETMREPLAATAFGSAADFLSEVHMYLDVSVLCAPQMAVFLDRLLPFLTQYGSQPFTVPETVIRQLNAQATDTDLQKSRPAASGIKQLKRLREANALTVQPTEGDIPLRSAFVATFARSKPTTKLLLLTADEGLANAVELLNASGLEGENITIACLQEEGAMVLWKKDEPMPPATWPEEAVAETAEFDRLLAELLGLYGIREANDAQPGSAVWQTDTEADEKLESVNIDRLLFVAEESAEGRENG